MKIRSILGNVMLASAFVAMTGAAQAADSSFKAAMVMPGSITDQSWNQQGYEAIMRAKEVLGIEVAYSEKVAQPDQLEAMSDYGRRGYNVVFGHGGEWVDAAKRAAKRNKDTLFVVTNGFVKDQGVASLTFNFKQFGYTLGFLAGKMSEKPKTGYISGQKIQIATDLEDGYKKGFASVHPDAEFLVTYTNEWDDVAKGKEAALNQLDQDIEVVFSLLDNAQIGVLQAAQEKGAWAFGVWQDVYENWPDTALQSAVMDFRVAIVDFLKDAMEGKVSNEVYQVEIGTDAGTLGTYHPSIPKEVVEETEEVIRKLHSHEIKL